MNQAHKEKCIITLQFRNDLFIFYNLHFSLGQKGFMHVLDGVWMFSIQLQCCFKVVQRFIVTLCVGVPKQKTDYEVI